MLRTRVLFLFCLFFWPLEFKFGKACILIATDVASRGLGQYVCNQLFSSFFHTLCRPLHKRQQKSPSSNHRSYTQPQQKMFSLLLLKKVFLAFFNFLYAIFWVFFSPKGAVFVRQGLGMTTTHVCRGGWRTIGSWSLKLKWLAATQSLREVTKNPTGSPELMLLCASNQLSPQRQWWLMPWWRWWWWIINLFSFHGSPLYYII